MRILLLSDIHANPWALRAVERAAGAVCHVLCAGDVVNYGPGPAESIAWLRDHGALTVRGNHDHAVAFAVDPKAAPAKQEAALAMRDWTREQLTPEDVGWLLTLERRFTWTAGGVRFSIVHGTPVNRLYDYRLTPHVSDALFDELTANVDEDVLLVGHTHLPLVRANHRGLLVVNPGSVGQPLDGDPRAAYAIWEDGEITLARADYDRKPALDLLGRIPLAPRLICDLQATLSRGAVA